MAVVKSNLLKKLANNYPNFLRKDLELTFATGYFASIYINNEKVFSSRNILNHIYKPAFHLLKKDIYPFVLRNLILK